MREYWDRDLNQMLLLDARGVWRTFDTKFETITFPSNPTNNQEFVSTLRDRYRYDSTNLYWKLSENNYFEVRTKEVLQCTRNGNQTIGNGSRWDINLIANQIGSNLTMNSGGITIPANTTVHLRADLSFYTSDTGVNFATMGFYSATKSSWLKCSKATLWGSSWNYQPSRCIDSYYTTGNTAETIDIRCGYYGFPTANTLIVVGNSGSDAGIPTSGNSGGASYFTCEVVNEYISEKYKTDSVYGDYVHAIITGGSQTPINANTNLNFGNIISSFGGITKVNDYTYKLQANKVYKVTSQVSSASGAYVTFGIYDVATNTKLGTHGHARNANSTDSISSSCDAIAIVTTGTTPKDICVRAIATSGTPYVYSSNTDIGMSSLIIEELGGSQRIIDSTITIPNKQNYAQVGIGTSTDGDLFRDSSDGRFKVVENGVSKSIGNDDFNSALCMKNFTFRYANFANASLVVAGKYQYGNNLASVYGTSLIEGSESNSPVWQGTGKWKFPKGLWRMSYFWVNSDSPDGTNAWNHQAIINKNGYEINRFIFSKQDTVGGMDASFGGNTEFRSNGNDIVGFDSIIYQLYSNADTNVLTVQFEKLM